MNTVMLDMFVFNFVCMVNHPSIYPSQKSNVQIYIKEF